MKIYIYIIVVLFSASCRNQTTSVSDENSFISKADTLPSEPYYPITQYIRDQIAYVDTTPLAIEKITFVNSKKIDSVIIDRQEFHQLAEEFLKPDLNDKYVKSLYTESSYNDLTLNSLAFNYTAKDPALELQQADVLLNPENNKVKNIIFKKIRNNKDTSVRMNGLWKHNMNFQINYILQPVNGIQQTKQIEVIWDRPLTTDY